MKKIPLYALIAAYQNPAASDEARLVLEVEIKRRGISLEEARDISVSSLKEMALQKATDRAVLKERSLRIFWRIFWRLVIPVILFFIVVYGHELWKWFTK